MRGADKGLNAGEAGLDFRCHDSLDVNNTFVDSGDTSRSKKHTSDMASDPSAADEFQLFDLRVEVVCPPGKRIMCGAKEGDYFTLQGEMLYLPPHQGISIYSLCESPNSDSCSFANATQP